VWLLRKTVENKEKKNRLFLQRFLLCIPLFIYLLFFPRFFFLSKNREKLINTNFRIYLLSCPASFWCLIVTIDIIYRNDIDSNNWLFQLFTCCYGLNTITVMLWNYQIDKLKPFFNDAESFHFIPKSI